MATTKKERIADLLRAQAASEAAEHFLRVGHGLVYFGEENVSVYIDCGGTELRVGVNWKALGTVNAAKTAEMAHFLSQAATLASNIQAIIDDTPLPEKAIETPRPLLEAAADELRNYLEADGGCDHSVGICSCEITGIISHLDHLLGRHEGKPDPYNCGHCAPDEGELLEEQNPLEAIDLDE